VIYHASEEFKAGALMHAALGPQIDPARRTDNGGGRLD
jgi:hypothetical protein